MALPEIGKLIKLPGGSRIYLTENWVLTTEPIIVRIKHTIIGVEEYVWGTIQETRFFEYKDKRNSDILFEIEDALELDKKDYIINPLKIRIVYQKPSE